MVVWKEKNPTFNGLVITNGVSALKVQRHGFRCCSTYLATLLF